MISIEMSAVAARAVPYQLICGTPPPPEATERIDRLTSGGGGTVDVWDGCASRTSPTRPGFAQPLAATATPAHG